MIAERPPPRLSVVIPSWNSSEPLARHLPAVVTEVGSLPGGFEVVVVDDGGDDGDRLSAVAAGAGEGVRVIRRVENGGFAAACNTGAIAAAGTFLIFLNADVHPEPGAFANLLAAIERHPEAGAVTPVIVNLAEKFAESTVRLRWHHGVFDVVQAGREGLPSPGQGEVRRIAYPCGGALACRRSEFLALGGFPQLFGRFYWEDAALGWMLWRSGLEVWEVGAARVLHDHAATIGSRVPPGVVRATYERNRLLFTWVHLAGMGAWLSHLAWIGPRWLAAILRHDPAARGLSSALHSLGGVRSERQRIAGSRDTATKLFRRVVQAGEAGWPCPQAVERGMVGTSGPYEPPDLEEAGG